MIYCDFREKETNLKTIISILKELKIQSRQLEFSVIKALMKNNTNGKVNEWVYILKNIKDKYHNVLQMFIMEIKQFY